MAGPKHFADHRGRDRQFPVRGVLLADDDDLLVAEQQPRRVEVADAQLRALQVGDHRQRLARVLLHRADDVRCSRVVGLGAVGEVQANRVDPGVHELTDHLGGR